MMNHRLQEYVQSETHQRWLENSTTAVFGHVNKGDIAAAREEVAHFWEQTEKMPDEPGAEFPVEVPGILIDSLRENFESGY